MYTKEEAYIQIAQLTERFEEQIASYKKSDYNETLTRRDFIDPFFKALGWDMDNSQGYAEAYREVIHEDKLKVGAATKAPDYSFRLPGGKRLFFVEAKKPSIRVKDEILPAYQVRRYGWSAKLPISLITDFEELAVYDCTKKPAPGDKASAGRIKYLTYKNYLDEFDFIWGTFSKGSVLKGSFDKFIAADTHKKGTATVDKEFLQSLDQWRMLLAANIAQRNQQLTEDELNFVVQQTIDRIIFLRIAEDRKVGAYGQLQNIVKTYQPEGEFYKSLYHQFTEADSKYNSGLFDFKRDKLSSQLIIDNKVLKNIINELYYPLCPYEFSVLGVEILGSAYEQFLGKQIKLDSRHRAVIEEKPEVRKAGGVYYTPQYIVDYIVENTVGKLAPLHAPKEGKTVTPEMVANITVCDPACGSGSFLLGAYDYLLKWHLEYYKPEFTRLTEIAGDSKQYNNKQRNDAIKERNKLPLTPEGALNTALKKQILLNNIYGVDLDTQAVEVTKLSLLLKCMEGETASSINAEMRFGERVLPTLDNNIKCGNSLIDLDYYDEAYDEEEAKKIRPFNWQQAFPKVFGSSLSRPVSGKQSPVTSGGFDVVVGNPPYVRIQVLKDVSPSSVVYFKRDYETAVYGNYDLYVLFVEQGLSILNNGGRLAFILPNKFFNTDYGVGIRDLLIKGKHLDAIIDFGAEQVFDNATTYCCLLFLQSSKLDTFEYAKVLPVDVRNKSLTFSTISITNHTKEAWNFRDEKSSSIISKLASNSINLIDLPCEISRGSSTGNDKIFVVEHIKGNLFRNGLGFETELEETVLKKPVFATDFTRYLFKDRSKFYIIFPYIIADEVTLIEESYFKSTYPLTYKYLKANKVILEERAQYQKWYGYSAPRSLLLHNSADIIIPLLADKGLFAALPENKQNFTLMAGGGFSITIRNDAIDKHYLLGLLNSKLLFWVLQSLSNVFRGGWITCTKQYFSQLPIKLRAQGGFSSNIPSEIISCVKAVEKLNQQKQTTTHPGQLEQLNQRIAYTDDKIDKLVYELYGLTAEEVAIVEGL